MQIIGYHGDKVINELPNTPIKFKGLQQVSGKNTRQIIIRNILLQYSKY